MRIVAGSARGRQLVPVRGRGIRPTSDKIRGAVFNILSFNWLGSLVLDLFAGTGALGIEALSRGAASAVFVDHHPYAVEIIEKNLLLCGFSGQGRVIRANPLYGLGFLEKSGDRFDVIFIDPPYGQGMAQKMLDLLGLSSLIKSGGMVVVECAKQETLSLPPGLQLKGESKVYGRTMINIFRKLDYEEEISG